MKQEFEEIHVRHRINKYWGKKTIPYKDFDLLQKMVICEQSQTALILIQQIFDDFKATSKNKEAIEQRELIIKYLHELYIFMEDIWKEGEFQCEYSHNVTMDNLRMKEEIKNLKLDVDYYKNPKIL